MATRIKCENKNIMSVEIGTPPSLAVSKGSAHTHVIISPSLLVKKVKVLLMCSDLTRMDHVDCATVSSLDQ